MPVKSKFYDLYGSFATAFMMFSIIPVPFKKREEGSFSYVYLFFPLVGAIEGALFYFLAIFLFNRGYGNLIRGAVLAAFPLVFTGGIHMDGFLDTVDAFFSYGSRDRKLEILKDPHVGSFAVIAGGLYLMLSFAFFGSLERERLYLIPVSFLLSRILSALSVLFFNAAKTTGTIHPFKEASDRFVKVSLIILLILTLSVIFLLFGVKSLIPVLAGGVVFLLHYLNCSKNFGGITGDLAGAFLQVFELVFVGCVVMI